MKFASFETIVEMIYHRLPGQKSDYSKAAQTGVSFTGGYLAGILCAIVSHPADVMVSKLNANRQANEAFGAAMSRIYKDIGFGGLWNGLPVRIVMIGTLTGLQWMIYDYFKIFMGVRFEQCLLDFSMLMSISSFPQLAVLLLPRTRQRLDWISVINLSSIVSNGTAKSRAAVGLYDTPAWAITCGFCALAALWYSFVL